MNRIIKALAALFTCLLLTLAPAASARAQGAGPAWGGLSQNQQQLLAPFKDSWDALPADRRERLTDNSRVWLSLTPEERTSLKEKFKVWQQMPQAQKEEARRGYHLYHELPVERRQQALETWQRLRRPTFPVPPVAPRHQLHQIPALRQERRGHEAGRPQALGEPRLNRPVARQERLRNRESRERLENRPRRQNRAHVREEFRQERCRRPGQDRAAGNGAVAPPRPQEEAPLTESNPPRATNPILR